MKNFYLLIGLFMLAVLVNPEQASAQSATRVVVSASAAPVFVKPDPAMVPLRMAKEGSVLNVIAAEDAWYRVEFQDPQFGRRVGYIEKRHVAVVAAPVQQAIDLTVDDARSSRDMFERRPSGASSQPLAETAAAPRRQASVAQPTKQDSRARTAQVREGFWFNGGLGLGSAGCETCLGRESGLSGGLSLGTTVSDRLLFGVGTTGWYKSQDGVAVSVGTVDARLRFYPSFTSGFFLTGGLGLGTVSLGVADFGVDREIGVGAVLGLGWDIRVTPNMSLTPFWNGSGVSTKTLNANFGQFGLGVTIH